MFPLFFFNFEPEVGSSLLIPLYHQRMHAALAAAAAAAAFLPPCTDLLNAGVLHRCEFLDDFRRVVCHVAGVFAEWSK